MDKLIKGGTIVTAEGEFIGDIHIRDEKIISIGEELDCPNSEVIDAKGKYVLPGGVDEHVHYGSFGSLKFDTTDAAIVGGTTTVVDFAPQPKGLSIVESVKKHKEETADGIAMCDYSFHGMVMDPTDNLIDEIKELPSHGISTLKFFMAYKGSPFMSEDDIIFRALQVAKDTGVTIMVHAENGDIVEVLQKQLVSEGKTEPYYHAESRPPLVEAEATKRAIYLAELADSPLFIVHVSCKEAIEEIKESYARGLPIYGETCTHYLTLTEDKLKEANFEGAKYVCSPALRKQEHLDSLWEAIEKGWLLAVGSDHCANAGGFEKDKKKGMDRFDQIPNGCPGVQNRLALLWTYGVETSKISRSKLVELYATNPAKICGLYPRKGTIAVGSDADIVIYNPEGRGKITVKDSLQRSDYETFEGLTKIGSVEKVLLRGKLVAEEGKYIGDIGDGNYIEMEAYGLCYSEFKNKDK